MMSVMAEKSIPHSGIDTLTGSLLLLVDNITQRLLRFEPTGQMNYVECFMQDMEWIGSMSTAIWSRFHINLNKMTTQQEIEARKAEGLIDSVFRLEEISSTARKKGVRILSLRKEFRITPTLAFLYDFGVTECATWDRLFSIPGQTVADVLLTLQQHRHIINSYSLYLTDLEYDDGCEDEGWLTRGEWRHQRISLANQYLKITLDHAYDEGNPYL